MRTSILVLSLLSFAVSGCCDMDKDHEDRPQMHEGMQEKMGHGQGMKDGAPQKLDVRMEQRHENMWTSVKEGVAVIYPTKGSSVSGTILFTQTDASLHVSGTVSGLEPNSTHAIHIHEFGDQSSADGNSAGGHFNPEKHAHGAPGSAEHHAGDLGNIKADGSGNATIDLTLNDISLAGMKDPIIGRGVVIHEKADDFGQPVGNAGGRIGVGVIGVKSPQ